MRTRLPTWLSIALRPLFNDTPWLSIALVSEQTLVQLLRQCGASAHIEANCDPESVGKRAADGGDGARRTVQ
jgi:hypothetical protein